VAGLSGSGYWQAKLAQSESGVFVLSTAAVATLTASLHWLLMSANIFHKISSSYSSSASMRTMAKLYSAFTLFNDAGAVDAALQ